MTKVGLVVNPVAGIGGAAGLKGSDGFGIQAAAAAAGSVSHALERAAVALRELPPTAELLTAAGRMGADAAQGQAVSVVWQPAEPSTPADTSQAVAACIAAGAELVLFAGGDGTARDVLRGMAEAAVPVLGIPCGVKMYSSCFAVSPAAAGRVAADWLATTSRPTTPAEVLDISEDQIREGLVEATLYGMTEIPAAVGRTQARKAATATAEHSSQMSAARGVVKEMRPGEVYLLGPGSTMAAVAEVLGVAKTPLGVDAVRDGELIAADLSEAGLLELTTAHRCHAVVTIIGGQGFLLGRGNQQFSPAVIAALAEPRLLVAATRTKLVGLEGPLLIDTGDAKLDAQLAGYVKVVVGSGETSVLQAVAAATV